jgi:hypothetical protein
MGVLVLLATLASSLSSSIANGHLTTTPSFSVLQHSACPYLTSATAFGQPSLVSARRFGFEARNIQMDVLDCITMLLLYMFWIACDTDGSTWLLGILMMA